MKICRTCCIPDTRPDTHFDATGQCSACSTYAKRPEIDWDTRKAELLALLDRHDGKCIVPSSAGKDSHYQVLKLKELGADVTAVTASTCHLTPIGRQNIDNLARYATTIEVSPNKTVRATLNRLGLELVGDISWPEHVSIFTTPFRVAADIKIPLIFYGENPQNQYGGPPKSEVAREMTRRWVSEFGGFLGLRPVDMIGQQGITEKDMRDYQAPSANDLEGVEAHFLGQYIPWDSHENAIVAIEHGMRLQQPSIANWWTFENLDNAQTSIHDHMMFRKYGFGRGAAQISVDVRAGRITREEALQWVKDYDGILDSDYMGVPIADVLDRIGMTHEELSKIMDRFTNWDINECLQRA